jgi:hypothetical protein
MNPKFQIGEIVKYTDVYGNTTNCTILRSYLDIVLNSHTYDIRLDSEPLPLRVCEHSLSATGLNVSAQPHYTNTSGKSMHSPTYHYAPPITLAPTTQERLDALERQIDILVNRQRPVLIRRN